MALESKALQQEQKASRSQCGKSHNRSRTGCLTCRLRRVKCDEAKPVCVRCQRVKRDCTWPSTSASPNGRALKSSSRVRSTSPIGAQAHRKRVSNTRLHEDRDHSFANEAAEADIAVCNELTSAFENPDLYHLASAPSLVAAAAAKDEMNFHPYMLQYAPFTSSHQGGAHDTVSTLHRDAEWPVFEQESLYDLNHDTFNFGHAYVTSDNKREAGLEYGTSFTSPNPSFNTATATAAVASAGVTESDGEPATKMEQMAYFFPPALSENSTNLSPSPTAAHSTVASDTLMSIEPHMGLTEPLCMPAYVNDQEEDFLADPEWLVHTQNLTSYSNNSGIGMFKPNSITTPTTQTSWILTDVKNGGSSSRILNAYVDWHRVNVACGFYNIMVDTAGFFSHGLYKLASKMHSPTLTYAIGADAALRLHFKSPNAQGAEKPVAEHTKNECGRLAAEWYDESIRLLRDRLASGREEVTADETEALISTSLLLATVDLMRGAHDHWSRHFRGVLKLITSFWTPEDVLRGEYRSTIILWYKTLEASMCCMSGMGPVLPDAYTVMVANARLTPSQGDYSTEIERHISDAESDFIILLSRMMKDISEYMQVATRGNMAPEQRKRHCGNFVRRLINVSDELAAAGAKFSVYADATVDLSSRLNDDSKWVRENKKFFRGVPKSLGKHSFFDSWAINVILMRIVSVRLLLYQTIRHAVERMDGHAPLQQRINERCQNMAEQAGVYFIGSLQSISRIEHPTMEEISHITPLRRVTILVCSELGRIDPEARPWLSNVLLWFQQMSPPRMRSSMLQGLCAQWGDATALNALREDDASLEDTELGESPDLDIDTDDENVVENTQLHNHDTPWNRGVLRIFSTERLGPVVAAAAATAISV